MTLVFAIIAWALSPISIVLAFLGQALRIGLLAIPIWLFWSIAGFGQHLSDVLPERFIGAGLFEIIGLMVACSCVRGVLLPWNTSAVSSAAKNLKSSKSA